MFDHNNRIDARRHCDKAGRNGNANTCSISRTKATFIAKLAKRPPDAAHDIGAFDCHLARECLRDRIVDDIGCAGGDAKIGCGNR